MDWNAIGAIGEAVSAVAVLITLVYLSVQLRQNTRALRSSAWQAIQDSEQRFDASLVADTAAIDVWTRGANNGLESFDDPAERWRFYLIGKQLVDLFQTHHYQHQVGMIEDELWQTWVSQYEEELGRSPGFRDMVRERYPHLRQSFRAFVDAHPHPAMRAQSDHGY